MSTASWQDYKQRRISAGLCSQCGAQAGGKYRCPDCQRKNTLYKRQRRRMLKASKVQCSLCLGIGHLYRTCKLNPDSIQ